MLLEKKYWIVEYEVIEGFWMGGFWEVEYGIIEFEVGVVDWMFEVDCNLEWKCFVSIISYNWWIKKSMYVLFIK